MAASTDIVPFVVKVRDVRYDTSFKLLFGEEGSELRLMSFLNAVLETNDDNKITKIQYLDGTHNSILNRTVHFDVKVQCECENLKGERYIVEMQKARIPGHTNRWVYYGARELHMVGQRNYQEAQAAIGETRTKLYREYYKRLSPIKVVTIFDFEIDELEVKNKDNTVVHWDICERDSKEIASPLLSWVFVILPRFLKKLSSQAQEPLNFVGDPLSSWLYLFTRSDYQEVQVTKELVSNDSVIAGAFVRMASLTVEETQRLQSSIDEEVSRIAREADSLAKGMAEGMAEGTAEGMTKGIDSTLMAVGLLNAKRKAEDVADVSGLPLEKVRKLEAEVIKMSS